MQNAIKKYEDVDSWKTIMFLYNSALKEIETKLGILNDEFLKGPAKAPAFEKRPHHENRLREISERRKI